MKSLSKVMLIKMVWGYVVYLFAVWTSFRIFVSLPVVIEELWFKPVLWLVPVFWIWLLIGKKIKFFDGRWGVSILWGMGLGAIYFGLIYFLVGFWDFAWNWNKVGVGFVTASVENLVFVGFLLPVFVMVWGQEKGLLFNGAMFAAIHLPIAVFSYRVDLVSLVGLALLTFSIGVMNGFVRLRTGNVIGAIVASFFWVVVSL